MEDRLAGSIGDAALIRNFRIDENGHWCNDRGYENLMYQSDAHVYLDQFFEPYDFMKVWTRHNSAEVYYLYEQAGYLMYEHGNSPTQTNRYVELAADRNIPRQDDPGTQLAPMGRWALLLNGHDEPLKFWGRGKTTPFAFRLPPGAPEVLDISPSYHNTVSPTNLNSGGSQAIATRLASDGYYGITDEDLVGRVAHDYRVSFITDTGSESPLSPAATLDFSITGGSGQQGRYMAWLEIPTGPDNVVARRIYRTGNKAHATAPADGTFYLLAQLDDNTATHFMDFYPDTNLLTEAPLSPITIEHTWKYASEWDNRMWLAGGEANGTRIIYSEQGLPEQFQPFSYYELGNAGAGQVTALYSIGDALLIFRERAIQVLTVRESDTTGESYKLGTLSNSIGTTATNTIKQVPTLGVLFLSYDGVYAISGDLVTKISQPLDNTFRRMNVPALPKATGVWSNYEQEYWVHFCIDGQRTNSMGAVLHLQDQPRWSTRFQEDPGFLFNHMDTMPNGWIVIAGTPVDDIASLSIPHGIEDGDWYNVNLQVWSCSQQSYLTDGVEGDDNYTFTYTPDAWPEAVWESAWLDFGDPLSYKQVTRVELIGVASGDDAIALEYCRDHKRDWESTGEIRQQLAEVDDTSSKDAIFSEATIGTDEYAEGRLIGMRWDVPSTRCRSFKFRLTASELVRIQTFRVTYVANTNRTPNLRERQ